MRRRAPVASQPTLPLAKKFQPPPTAKKVRKKPANLEEWVLFGGDKRVVRVVKATSYDSSIAYLRREFGISIGPQGYAKRRVEFPDNIVISPGMTESECFGIREIGRVSQSRP